ncbi:MAG TPA: ABC transporter permease [Anaerolineales bacterium]|nr:ABC transporter permease [Anaerolineales bacterium]
MLENLLQAAIIANILYSMVRIATPILFAAMGELVAERSGVMNMGLEGTMLTAAFIGFMVAEKTGSLLLAICLACLAGGLMSLILAVMTITLGVDQIITGLALNLLASGGTLFWFRLDYAQTAIENTPLVEFLKPVSLPILSNIPYLGKILFSHNLLTYLSFLMVPVVWFFLYKTSYGLKVRSLGENPKATDTTGTNVNLNRYIAVVIGGLMAGLGGAFVSIGSVERFFPDMTAGKGWLAIVIVIAGNWKPSRILLATLIFAFFDAFQLQVQSIGAQLPYQILLALPYIVAIIALISGRARSEAPESLGMTYRRE